MFKDFYDLKTWAFIVIIIIAPIWMQLYRIIETLISK